MLWNKFNKDYKTYLEEMLIEKVRKQRKRSSNISQTWQSKFNNDYKTYIEETDIGEERK